MNSRITDRRFWGLWAVNALTVVLCVLWAIAMVWATIVSFRPPDDDLGRGDVWFSDRVTLASYEKAIDLAPFFPDSVIKVSESGISTHEDIKSLEALGYHAVLVGEILMRQSDVARAARNLITGAS